MEANETARLFTTEEASELAGYLDRLELDPENLARAEQRVSAIFDTARKFKTAPENLPNLQQTLHDQLDATLAANDIQALTEHADDARDRYNQQAAKPTAVRKNTGKSQARQVTNTIKTMALQGGS